MILGIESSCDESSIAFMNPERGVISEWTHTQIDLHRLYGGVVPDLASREHLTNFPVILDALRKEHFLDESVEIEQVAVTCGPGLAGCLAIGIAFAKSIALLRNARVVGVNHLRAHAFSPFISLFEKLPEDFFEEWKKYLPHLGLLVSGGNTLLFEIDRERRIKILAQTVDDAAGEALDKGGKLLGLPYPGGPSIEKYAQSGNPDYHAFPRGPAPPGNGGDFKFSFSGLKTSLRYHLEKLEDREVEEHFNDLCASYQMAVVDQLTSGTSACLESGGAHYGSLGLSGGVAHNQLLRQRFVELAQNAGLPLRVAQPQHTGDNAAMIAFASMVDPGGLIRDGLQLGFHPALALSG